MSLMTGPSFVIFQDQNYSLYPAIIIVPLELVGGTQPQLTKLRTVTQSFNWTSRKTDGVKTYFTSAKSDD